MLNIIEIKDFSDPNLDVYARLSENQLVNRADPDQGLFIAESPNVILRALQGGWQPVSLLLEHKHITGQAKEVVERCGNIPIFTSTLPVLTQLTGFPLTRGVLCAMRRRPIPSIPDLLLDARRVAVLEDVMNPTNLGAIFRSAAALGVDAVFITPNSTDPLYRRCIRVSMGTVFQVPWGVFQNWPEDIAILQNAGFKTAAMALKNDSISLDDPVLVQEEKLAILLGTEGDGLSDGTLAKCDYTVRIPMDHDVDSLNVAAAAAVTFWEICRKRTK